MIFLLLQSYFKSGMPSFIYVKVEDINFHKVWTLFKDQSSPADPTIGDVAARSSSFKALNT